MSTQLIESAQNRENVKEEVLDYQHPELIERLVEKCGMPLDFAEESFFETKRFLWLCGTEESAQPLAPTEPIDEVWHNFLLFTREYQTFCQRFFGFFIHHVPLPQSEVEKADGSIIERTISRAVSEFGSSVQEMELWNYRLQPGSCGYGVCGASTNCQGVAAEPPSQKGIALWGGDGGFIPVLGSK